MTTEQFITRFRPALLGWLTDAYACRKLNPSDFGQLVDSQVGRLESLLRQMWAAARKDDEATVPVADKAALNGRAALKVG